MSMHMQPVFLARMLSPAEILRGEPNSVENYLGFLKSGNSDYSLNVLKKAGADLTTPQAVEETFAVMEGYIDRLEKLLDNRL